MKYLIFLCLLASFTTVAQNVNIKKLSIQTVAGTDYYVSADTTAEGEIIIRLKAVADQAALLSDQFSRVEQEIKQIDARIDALQAQKKDAQGRRKEIEKMQANLPGQRGQISIPTIDGPKAPTPSAKPKKKRKQ